MRNIGRGILTISVLALAGGCTGDRVCLGQQKWQKPFLRSKLRGGINDE
ncbi:hypothetical protein KAX17_06275 [Candidatus Bipolaricaulota bacterium]|nr:hypothetical protein [Candidatus Bipolaricaulota bacterium]